MLMKVVQIVHLNDEFLDNPGEIRMESISNALASGNVRVLDLKFYDYESDELLYTAEMDDLDTIVDIITED